MGLVDGLNSSGYKPTKNTDGFTPIKGFYRATIKEAELGEYKGNEQISLAVQIVDTISGDPAEGRYLRKRYQIGGTLFDGSPVTEEIAREKIKELLNDAFTIEVTLDTGSDDALFASLSRLVDKDLGVRAYHFTPKRDDAEPIQQWKILPLDQVEEKAAGTSSSKVTF